jgi:hypothetical protein
VTAVAIADPPGPERRESLPGYLALLWLLSTGALVALAIGQPQRSWSPPPRTEVVLGGEYYRLDAPHLEWLRSFSALHFSEGREAARGLLESELERGLDEIFAAVRGRLPQFADWYYSLGGEYSRLGMAALAQLNRADGNFVANKAASMLFPTDEWEAALGGLDRRMLATLEAQQQSVRADWLAQLGERLAPQRIPAPLRPAGEAVRAPPLELDGFGARRLAEEQQALAGRIRMSSAAGGAAAGTVLWRQAAARAGTATGRAIAARGASRTAARAGAATTGGLAACAATGPAAAGCALLAGAVAWVATDWALLRVDEMRHRDELLGALDAGLGALQAQMLEEVLAAYDAVTREQEASAEVAIASEFKPAQAGR